MAKTTILLCLLGLTCLTTLTKAFVRERRSAVNNQQDKDANEGLELGKVEDDNGYENQVRKRRQFSEIQSTIQEVFAMPSQNYDNRVYRNTDPNQQYIASNNYIQQPYNGFPVYGLPNQQPQGFIPGPVINNHYLPAASNYVQKPYFCYYPIIIIAYPQNRPSSRPDDKPDNKPDNKPDPNLDSEDEKIDGFPDKFGGFSEDKYNNSITGISLDPIEPARIPSVTAPPLNRPSQQRPNQQRPNQQVPNQQTPNQQRPNQQRPNQQFPNQQVPNQQRPSQQRPPQQRPNPPTTRRPQTTIPPLDGFDFPDDSLSYPENSVSQNVPNRPRNEDLNPCINAILYCCLPNRNRFITVERCFDINNCPGAFQFGNNPCSSSLVSAVIAENRRYGNLRP